ncbi:phenazine biosynthesis-like protein [Bisporella sp. PMI_857]|nr:phenazine biosynthesis-like protein [Bisporella sp. PMI_857]
MKLDFTTLDVFTTTRYNGNPLAVIKVPAVERSNLTQEQKQKVAQEFNLSEIVFLHQPAEGGSYNDVTIDIFTSYAEVPFAGHPTIGSSHFLLNELDKDTEAVITKAGRIPISKDPTTGQVQAVVPQTFHIHKVTYESSLAATPAETTSIVKGMSFIFSRLPDLETLKKATENLNVVKHGTNGTYEAGDLDEGWQVGLVGTMYFVDQGVDEFGRKQYRTRMWASREDPGTGSASSALGCYLATLEPKDAGTGPFRYAFTQGVEMGRRNDIAVEVIKDDAGGIQTVLLSGSAVKVMEGSLEI